MTKKELMARAVELGIVGRSTMNKKDLAAAIDAYEGNQNESISYLMETLGSARKGRDFADGTVIRWVNRGLYLYVAVKAAGKWFTTARSNNSYVPQVLTFSELLEILKKEHVSDVEVAVKWEAVA